jgi:hypothetical protein
MFHGVEEVNDLQATREVIPAHIFQALGPINQDDYFAGMTHATANGFAAKERGEIGQGAEV